LDKGKLLAELKEKLEAVAKAEEEAKAGDPFWWYEPSDGTITEDGVRLMSEFLRPEDIPEGGLQSQRDVHLSKAEIVLDAGGNQGGKTTAGCIEAFITATGALPFSLEKDYPKEKLPGKGPQHVRVVGVDHQTFLRNLLPTYQKWVPRGYLIDGRWDRSYNAEGRVLSLAKNGVLTGTIEFMTNQQDVESFQGPPRHKVIYDEEPRSEIYRENLMRFTTAERLNILFCMTPTSGLSWVKDAILDKGETEDGKSIACFKVPSITNRKANLSVLREILRGLGSYEEIKMRLLGEFVSLSGLVYGNRFNPKVHVIEPFPIKAYDHLIVRGIDPHLVKPSACVEMAVDREGNKYVVGCYLKDADTEELKKDLADRAKANRYRLGWSIFDKSSDSTIRVFGDRNIYLEMTRGVNAVPAAFKSDKFTGSINAGVDEIKKDLKLDERTGKPRLFFFNTPEVKPLIQAMQSIERDTYANEDEKGKKDRIKEGKWDLHACLRYIYQRQVHWLPPQDVVVEPMQERYI
jgi:phage terminase large subunit-like protein